jgi:hypothetical protein
VDEDALRQFCFALDRFHVVLSRRRFFPFTLDLFKLFFEMFHATQLGLPLFPHSPMFDARMCMWG